MKRDAGEAMDAGLRETVPAKRRRGGNQRTGPGKAALAILVRMAAGEALTAWRIFPGPWHYRIGVISLGSASTASSTAALSLIRFGLVAPVNADAMEDFLEHELTAAGKTLLGSQPGQPDTSQLDWTVTP